MSPDVFPDPNSPVHTLKSRDRWETITELLDLLVASGKITARNRPEIEAAVKRRETSMSTAIGSGLAIPHTTTDLVTGPVAVFGRSKKGINFDAHNQKPVHRVCLFLLPKNQYQQHLNLLASIARLLQRMDF